jgi:hypothetical protein
MSKSFAAAATTVRAKALARAKVQHEKEKNQRPADEAQVGQHDAAPAHMAHDGVVLAAADGALEGEFSFAQVLADAANSEATFYGASSGGMAAGFGSMLQDSGSSSDDGDAGAGGTLLLIGAVGLAGLGVAVAVGGGGGSKNVAPVFASSTKTINTNEDTAAAAFAPGATDADNDTLTYSFTQGTKGVATLVNGQVVYTPNANANGNDTFTITASDGKGGTASQTVSVVIAAVNDAPTVTATQTITTDENVAKALTVAGSDVDGDTLTYSVTTAAAHGTVTAGATAGSFTYTPTNGYDGADSFKVTVSDGKGGTAVQTVNVTVNNVGPTAEAITVSAAGSHTNHANQNETYTIQLGNYTYTINGFDALNVAQGVGDHIVSPAGVPVSLNNSSFTDGSVTLEYAQGGQVATIVITGLTNAQDAALFQPADLNTVFGAGTFA